MMKPRSDSAEVRPITRRRFLHLALSGAGVASAAAVLAACGGGAAATASTSSPLASTSAVRSTSASASSSIPAVSSAAASASSSAQAGAQLKLGLITNLSGPFVAIGDDMVRATDLYLDQHDGALGGFKVTVIREDEGMAPADSLRKIRKLIEEDKVDVLMGIDLSPTALAARDIIDQAKLPTIITNAGAVDITGSKKSKYIFRTSFTNWQAGAALGEWTYKNVGKKVVAMAPDYAAGHEVADGFAEVFTKAGGTILDKVFPPLGNSDYGPFLGKIKQTNPEAVWAFFSTGEAVKYIQQYAQFVSSSLPLAGFGLLTLDVVDAIGKTALLVKGTDNNYDISLDNPANKQFVAAFRKKYNRDPQLAQFQYDGMILLDKALQSAKGDKSSATIVSGLEKVSTFDSVRGRVKIDPETHGLIQPYFLATAVEKNGKTVVQVGEKLATLAPTSVYTGTL